MPRPSSFHRLLAGDVVIAARGLLGCTLQRRLPDGSILAGRIVETEAYHQSERACHANRGRTPRNATMFGQPGQLYVYRIYGIYFCSNIVCEDADTAAVVLIRALEPMRGGNLRMSGPGLLSLALNLSTDEDGVDLLDAESAVRLLPGRLRDAESVASTRRVGFSFEDDLDWRFHIEGNPYVSKGRPGVVVKRNRRRPE